MKAYTCALTLALSLSSLATGCGVDEATPQTPVASTDDLSDDVDTALIPEIHSFCTKAAEAAGNLMLLRQSGKPMATVMETIDESWNPETQASMRRQVAAAYDYPRLSAKPSVQEAIQEFENAAYLECARDHGLVR